MRPSFSVLALSLVILIAGLAGSASAAVVGLQRVSASTATNSTDKGVRAVCPAGKLLLGAGGDVTPGFGDVLFDDVRPSADLKSLTVNALEDETGTGQDWYVEAFAICAYPPPGLQRVAATSALDSAAKSVPANCPAGKRLLGLGAEINGGNRQVLLDDLRPNSTLTGALVSAVEDETGHPGNWSLTAYAICANPVTGLERVSLQSAVNSSGSKAQEVPCPAGKQIVGLGGDINTPNRQVVLDALFPNTALTGAGHAAWEDDTGNTANWSLRAYAICAAAAQREVADAGFGPFSTASAAKTCGGGQHLTGVGAELTGGFGEVILDRLTPNPGQGPVTEGQATARTTPAWANRPWALRLYTLCRTPLAGPKLTTSVAGPVDSNAAKSVHIDCPSGMRAVGAGGQINTGSTGEVLLEHIRPNAGLQSIDVFAHEDANGFGSDWSVMGTVLCNAPPAGLQRVAATSAFDQAESKTATARCPAGKTLLGTGGGMAPSSGSVVLDDVRPDPTLTSVSVTGVAATEGAFFDWSVTAYAICANI